MLRIFYKILLGEIILLAKYVNCKTEPDPVICGLARSRSPLPDDLVPELLCVTEILSLFSRVQNTSGGGSPLASHTNLQSDQIEASQQPQSGGQQRRIFYSLPPPNLIPD